MTLIIEKRTIEQTGPGPYCMSDSEVAYTLDRARQAALARAPAEPDRRPRNTARDSLTRLAEAGDISPHEHRAGREIAVVSYITTQPARGQQVATYGERTDCRAPGNGEAFFDMERRFRDWHEWAKREPFRPRGASSMADATLLVCVDGWGATEIARRFGGRLATTIERLRLSLAVYAVRAGWCSDIPARLAIARAA